MLDVKRLRLFQAIDITKPDGYTLSFTVVTRIYSPI